MIEKMNWDLVSLKRCLEWASNKGWDLKTVEMHSNGEVFEIWRLGQGISVSHLGMWIMTDGKWAEI